MSKGKKTPEEVREAIRNRIAERGLDMKALSLQLGRAHSYLQQFLNRGTPRELKESDRAKLAEMLGLDETELGASPKLRLVSDNPAAKFTLVPEYNAQVSAGGGAENGHERVVAQWPFQPNYIRNYLGLDHADLAIVEVRGDSMEPTLQSGDRVLVNTSDKQISQSGIFVMYDGGGTVIKRVDKQVGNNETVTLISDNRIHPPYQVNLANLNVIGRVVWVARRL